MRWTIAPALAALAVSAIVASGCGQAQALESFVLEEHDHLIAEASGCYADCRSTGPHRTCTVRDLGCRVVCKTLPECSAPGRAPVKVCAVLRDRP